MGLSFTEVSRGRFRRAAGSTGRGRGGKGRRRRRHVFFVASHFHCPPLHYMNGYMSITLLAGCLQKKDGNIVIQERI